MTQSDNIFTLEKSIWTEADFEVMGWHDASIHALCFENNGKGWTGDLLFDIDYIFKWVHPEKEGGHFSFWVSPCTLIFKNAIELDISLQTGICSVDTQEISDICLIKTATPNSEAGFIYNWTIELQAGYIKLKSDGFTQIVRKEPIYTGSQQLTQEERSGINFSKQPFSI